MIHIFIGGRRYVCDDPVGIGTQSQVFPVGTGRVAKVYRDPDPERTRRLEAMMAAFQASRFVQPDTSHSICIWPEQLVHDEAGSVVGYEMRRVDDHPLGVLLEHGTRLRAFPNKDWKFLLTVANNLAQTVRVLHDYDIIVGDLAPSNIHVGSTGLVSLLDCDSLQFAHEGKSFACDTLTPEYAAPELLAAQAGVKSLETDRFSLAVLVCQLLLCGTHPFVGFPTRPLTGEPSTETNIMHGITTLTNADVLELPVEAIRADVLPAGVAALARQAFGTGHASPKQRPAAEEWFAVLDAVWHDVRECDIRPNHTHRGDLDYCPWCRRADSGLFDPFPVLVRAPRPTAAPATSPDAAASTRPDVEHVPARSLPTYSSWAIVALTLALVLTALITLIIIIAFSL